MYWRTLSTLSYVSGVPQRLWHEPRVEQRDRHELSPEVGEQKRRQLHGERGMCRVPPSVKGACLLQERRVVALTQSLKATSAGAIEMHMSRLAGQLLRPESRWGMQHGA